MLSDVVFVILDGFSNGDYLWSAPPAPYSLRPPRLYEHSLCSSQLAESLSLKVLVNFSMVNFH
jgi:hypothetical protein